MRKYILKALAFLCIIIIAWDGTNASIINAKKTYVHSYYRKDGTYVHGYYRNSGGSSSSSGYSSSGYSSSSSSSSSGSVDRSDSLYNNSSSYDNTSSKNNSLVKKPSGSTYKSFKGTPVVNRNNTVNLYRNQTLVGTVPVDELVYVNGYYRKDGTYVRPHFRTYPNRYLSDNFSTYGLSTLLPLEDIKKCYNYSLSKKTDTKTNEIYFFKNISNYANKKKLSSSDKKKIRSYASKLSNNENTFNDGIALYKKFGMSSFEAAAQSKFDKNAVMNWELYISSVLKGYGIQVNDDEAFLYKDYLTLINLFKNSQFDFNKVYNFGLFLYEYYGLDKDSAVEQVLMDMLQNNFEFVYDYTYLVERFQNLECFFYLDFRNYLENQGVTEYNSLIKYYMENYILSFESFASGLQKSKLAKIYEEGKMFYSQFGIEDNALKEKIEDDIEMYFINAVCE